MYQLTKSDYKKIRSYKKYKQEEIALYFFEKFKDDVLNVTFWKINHKFGSIPFEKGDLIHLIWNGIKRTLNEYDEENNFTSVLIQNCYFLSIKEVKKFINNKEMIMNYSTSLEVYESKIRAKVDKNRIVNIGKPTNLILDDLIAVACKYIKKYSQPTIKRVLYLKSIGYSVNQIAKELRKTRYCIDTILKDIEKIVEKFY